MDVSSRVLSLLKEKHLQQKSLAMHLDISPSTLNTWLQKGRDIPAQYILRICEFVGCSAYFLLEGSDRAQPLDPDQRHLSGDAMKLAEIYDLLDDVDSKTIIMGEALRQKQRMEQRDSKGAESSGQIIA